MTKETIMNEFLSTDFNIMADAVRRLQHGTGNLQSEDKEEATDLFYRLKLALNDHISFEETCIPEILQFEESDEMLELCKQLLEEHRHISGLLEAAENELLQSRAGPFRAILRAVSDSLDSHFEFESRIPFENWIQTLGDDALSRMKKRKEVGFLGLE